LERSIKAGTRIPKRSMPTVSLTDVVVVVAHGLACMLLQRLYHENGPIVHAAGAGMSVFADVSIFFALQWRSPLSSLASICEKSHTELVNAPSSVPQCTHTPGTFRLRHPRIHMRERRDLPIRRRPGHRRPWVHTSELPQAAGCH